MRSVALCQRLSDATRLDNRLRNVAGVTRFSLVTRTRSYPLFLGALTLDWLRLGPAGWLDGWRALARGHLRITAGRIDDTSVIEWLRRVRPDVGLHAMPVIYSRELIECFRLGILNAHIGQLPRYRGRSVMEWAILNGDPVGITTFFIDEGIDTGRRIVVRELVDVSAFRDVASAKRHLFSLDAEMYALALERLQLPGFEHELQDVADGKRFYVMSKLFTTVVEHTLRLPATP